MLPAAAAPGQHAQSGAIRTGRCNLASINDIVENVVGCKWTLHVLAQVRAGVNRPGQLARSAPGLTTKVLNERLRKLVKYGVLERIVFPEIPPHVEYRLTPLGARLNGVLDAIADLQQDLDRGRVATRLSAPRRRPGTASSECG